MCALYTVPSIVALMEGLRSFKAGVAAEDGRAMACCGGGIDDETLVPTCSEVQCVEANGYVEVKTSKLRAKLFKRISWTYRYCVLSQGHLYGYKDWKGKSSDPETFVIDLRGTLKISVGSHVARRPKKTVLETGCVVTIVDRNKRKHKLRFGVGEEREYWLSHLSKATDRELMDIGEKQNTPKHVVKNQPGEKEIIEGDQTATPSSEAVIIDDRNANVGADQLAEKRRGAKDYVKWLRRHDSILERRERHLCAEIESSLPVRTNAGLASNSVVAIESESSSEAAASRIISETFTAKGFEDDGSIVTDICSMPLEVPDHSIPLEQSTQMDCKPAEALVPANQSESSIQKVDQDIPELLDVQWTKSSLPRPQRPCATTVQLPGSTTIQAKRRTSALIAKMHEIFSAPELLPRQDFVNSHSFTAASGTMQFPAYRSAHPSLYCHKLVSPPKPKWWATSYPSAKPAARFKFDHAANPVWKTLSEKSSKCSPCGDA